MNIEKFLWEQFEKETESLITESDKLFIQQIIEKIKENKRRVSAEESLKKDKDNS